MLEEALRDPAKHPAEVAQAMLSFVRSDLPQGGTSTETRFFNLVGLLCSRVFGELQEGKDKDFRHEPGGWLSAQNRWRTTPAPVPQPYGGRARAVATSRVTPSMDLDPVVQLLGPVQPVRVPSSRSGSISNSSSSSNITSNKGHLRSLIETLSAGADTWSEYQEFVYPFPFLALPEPLQRQFLLLLEALAVGNAQNPHQFGMGIGMVGPMGMGLQVPFQPQNQHLTTQQQMALTENSRRLFGTLLRRPPQQQTEVLAYQQKKLQAQNQNQAQPLQLSPGLASPQSMASPTAGIGSNAANTIDPQKEKSPNLALSMLEYYLFLFVRYPLAAPHIPRPSASQASFGSYTVPVPRRPQTPYGEQIYYTLFSRYFRHFLPHTQNASPHGGAFPSEMKESEFFLRTVIAFWLEVHGPLLTTSKAAQSIHDRFRRTGVSYSSPLADLNMSYDLAIGKFDPPPTMAQNCLRRLVIHLISDPTIMLSVQNQQWCLSPAMTALQQPFYNYIRSTFRHASIHQQGSVFYTAMNAWLIWLEPWNVSHGNKQNATKRIISSVSGATTQTSSESTIVFPTPERKSTYTKAWEPYLAANLFLYTVPLAIFLRRARELDFSSREMNRSLKVVKRVFRVFTPEVVHSLESITQSLNREDLTGHQYILKQMAEHHWKNVLGDYAPSLGGNLSLTSCQAEVRGMLEEIMLQHMKRVRELGAIDKFAAFLEGFFGHGVVSGEEMAIQSLVERAKTIVGLPIDYEIFAQELSKVATDNKGAVAKGESSTALRNSQGVLTEEGRRQLLTGQFKCNPADISFIGDSMYGRLKSHEIGILVSITTWLSNWLNKKLGLLPADAPRDTTTLDRFHRNLRDQNIGKGWRFNLRWFADYRNFCASFVITMFVWKVIF